MGTCGLEFAARFTDVSVEKSNADEETVPLYQCNNRGVVSSRSDTEGTYST